MDKIDTPAPVRSDAGNNHAYEVKGRGHSSRRLGSILFVHGAGHGSWCWRDHFTAWFEERQP